MLNRKITHFQASAWFWILDITNGSNANFKNYSKDKSTKSSLVNPRISFTSFSVSHTLSPLEVNENLLKQ